MCSNYNSAVKCIRANICLEFFDNCFLISSLLLTAAMSVILTLQWTLSVYLGSAEDGGQGGQGGAGGAAGDHRLQADPGRAQEAGLLYSGQCTVQVYCTGTCTARRTCWSWPPASARASCTGRPSPGASAGGRCQSWCSHTGQRARHRDIAGAFCAFKVFLSWILVILG